MRWRIWITEINGLAFDRPLDRCRPFDRQKPAEIHADWLSRRYGAGGVSVRLEVRAESGEDGGSCG